MKQAILIVLFFLGVKLQAQTPQWQWINVGGGNLNPTANGVFQRTKQIGTDARGNIYGIAPTSGDVNIDTLLQLSGFGYDDFVVYSYSCDGSFRWVQQFGSYTFDGPGGIIVSPDGDVYVSGGVMVNYWGDAHFADSIIPATNNMYKGYFMAKLDSSGHLTHLNLPGPPGPTIGAEPMRMEADKDGNPVVLTWFSDSATWNGFHINGRGHYLVKFDKNCNLTGIVELGYKHAFNNSPSIENTFFSIDESNNIFLRDYIQDTVYIAGDTIVIDPISADSGKTFIAKFNQNGNHLWHKVVVSYEAPTFDSMQIVYGKPVLYKNKVYMEGNTRSGTGSKFLGIPVSNPLASSNDIQTKVFAAFDKNTGNIKGAINIHSVANIFHAPISIQSNHLVAAPASGGMIILNQNDTLVPGNSPSLISMDTGLTLFNWGTSAHLLLSNTHFTPSYLHVDHNENILLGGGLTGPITNSYGDTTNLVSTAENFCIAKIALSNDSCDCAVSVPSVAVVSSSGNTLSIQGSATNQPDSLYIFWGDGDSALYTAGSIATHTYANAGPWNVCLRAYGFCGVEDSCLTNLYSGVYPTEDNIELTMNVYPNPFNSYLNIELSNYINQSNLSVYDVTGRLVYTISFSGIRIRIDLKDFKKGVYFIKLITNKGAIAYSKIVKN